MSNLRIGLEKSIFIMLGIFFLHVNELKAQVQKNFRHQTQVKISELTTESIYEVKTENGMSVGGKVLVTKDPVSGLKDNLASGYLRGQGATLTGSLKHFPNEGPVNPGEPLPDPHFRIPGYLQAKFKYGNNNIEVTTNLNGEWSNTTYTYTGTNVNIKITGDNNGNVNASGTVKYSTETTPSSYGGAITINTDGGSITSLTGSVNYTSTPLGGGYTFKFNQSNTYTFSNDDILIMFRIGLTW